MQCAPWRRPSPPRQFAVPRQHFFKGEGGTGAATGTGTETTAPAFGLSICPDIAGARRGERRTVVRGGPRRRGRCWRLFPLELALAIKFLKQFIAGGRIFHHAFPYRNLQQPSPEFYRNLSIRTRRHMRFFIQQCGRTVSYRFLIFLNGEVPFRALLSTPLKCFGLQAFQALFHFISQPT